MAQHCCKLIGLRRPACNAQDMLCTGEGPLSMSMPCLRHLATEAGNAHMWPAADAYAMYELLLSIARQRRILHVLQVLNTCTAKKVCARSCHAKRLSVSNTLPARSYIASTSHSYSPSFLFLITPMSLLASEHNKCKWNTQR